MNSDLPPKLSSPICDDLEKALRNLVDSAELGWKLYSFASDSTMSTSNLDPIDKIICYVNRASKALSISVETISGHTQYSLNALNKLDSGIFDCSEAARYAYMHSKKKILNKKINDLENEVANLDKEIDTMKTAVGKLDKLQHRILENE